MRFVKDEDNRLSAITLNQDDVQKIVTKFTSDNFAYDWREVIVSYIRQEKDINIDIENIWIYYEQNN